MDEHVCTREEFNKCVDEMSKAEWMNAKPIYTKAMQHAGILPNIGMVVNMRILENLTSIGCIEFKNDIGFLFRYEENNLCDFIEYSDDVAFKPLPVPIELINGDAYQFDFGEEVNIKGLYNDDECDFYCVGINYSRENCTNIKHLT